MIWSSSKTRHSRPPLGDKGGKATWEGLGGVGDVGGGARAFLAMVSRPMPLRVVSVSGVQCGVICLA